jgi:hypothetical protein
MKFPLNDGTYAHLWRIVQTSDYRQDYLKVPTSAEDEIKRIAQTYMPASCWRPAPLILIAANNETLMELMRRKDLPAIMCVAEFYSYRKRPNSSTKPKAVYLHVVWLQEEFLPYLCPENEARFQQIDWDKYLPNTKVNK